MKTCMNLKHEDKKKKKFGFKAMKKATECLMIVTMSAVLSAGFTKNVYGDEKMGATKNIEEEKINLTKPIPTKTLMNFEKQFFDELNSAFRNRENVNLEKLKLVLKGKTYHEKIIENKKNLMELGLNDKQIKEIVEIAKKYDINDKDSIDFKNFFDSKNVTHGFLAYLCVADKNNLLNTQDLDIFLHHINSSRENTFLLEMSDYIYTNSLSSNQKHKTLVGKFESRAQAPSPLKRASPTLKDVEIIELAGALTGNTIEGHITQENGNYLIETSKENLRDAVDKLEASLNETEPGTSEYENTEKDLETLKELLSRREKTFDLKIGGGTGITYDYEGFNIGADYSLMGDLKEKEESNKFQVNLGYIGSLNRFMNGYIQGGYSYDETNLFNHTISGQTGLSFYLNSPEHLLTLSAKYSYTFDMGKEGHEYGGGLRYDYKNIFGTEIEGTNKSVGINFMGYLPITKNFGLFGEVGSNYYWNQIITGDVKAGVKFSIDNFDFRVYGEGSLRYREEGGL